MTLKPDPPFQPIDFLPLFKTRIFDRLKAAKEQVQSLLEARKKPYVLNDAIVNRMIQVFTEQRGTITGSGKNKWRSGRPSLSRLVRSKTFRR